MSRAPLQQPMPCFVVLAGMLLSTTTYLASAGSSDEQDVCGSAPLLTSTAQIGLAVLRGLSDSDFRWVLQQVADRHTSLTAEVQSLESRGSAELLQPERAENDDDVSTHPFTVLFLAMCAIGALFFVWTVWCEHKRYVTHNCSRQGSFREYLKYRFCHWYTWTPGSAGIVLCALSLTLLVSGGLLLKLLTNEMLSASLWAAWLWIASPDGGVADTASGRIVGVFVSCGGMLVFALLMSVVSSCFEDALQEIRDGGLPVVEGDHCVLLGWNPMLPTLIAELCLAAESRGGNIIAVLTSKDKAEVEEELRDKDIDFKNSIIVIRKGVAHCEQDLVQVAVESARQVLILSASGVSREDADSNTLNVLLTLHSKGWPRNGISVVQCELVMNQRLFGTLIGSQVITTGDKIGELLVQSSFQRGLAAVFNAVFCFEGDEFYIHYVEGISGKTFQEVLFALPQVIVIGLVSEEGMLELLPQMQQRVLPKTKVVLLAEDVSKLPQNAVLATSKEWTDALALAKNCQAQKKEADSMSHTRSWSTCAPQSAEKVVIIGWNESIGAVLVEIDNHVFSGSEVLIFSPTSEEERKIFLEKAQKRRNRKYQNLTVHHKTGPLGARFQLEELPLEQARKIFILAEYSGDSKTANDADCKTIAAILQVKDILKNRLGKDDLTPVIIPQISEVVTESACVQMGVTDYINPNRLGAQMMAMVCENSSTSGIISNILSPTGCNLVLRDLSYYAAGEQLLSAATKQDDITVSFNDVAAAVALKGEIAFGWSEEGGGPCGPWELNPKDRNRRRSWPSNNRYRIVVLDRDAERIAMAGSRMHGSLQDASKKVQMLAQPVEEMQKLVREKRENVNPQESAIEKMGNLIRKRRETMDLDANASGDWSRPPSECSEIRRVDSGVD